MNTNLNQTEDQLILYWVHLPEHTEEHLQGYIGVTKDFEKRMNDHRWKASNERFQNAINKYGWDNLVKEVIVRGPEKDILELEQMFRPKERIGWNLAIGGGKPPSPLGRILGDATKAKIGAAQRGEKNHMYGNTHSDATKAKMSASRTGEKNHMYGNTHSVAAKAKMSAAHKSKTHSDETKAKMSASRTGEKSYWYGKAHSDETKARIRATLTGNTHNKKTCPHCGNLFAPGPFARYHGDNCNHKGANK